MDGFEATKAIRAIETERNTSSPSRIIALTGLGSNEDISKAYDAGVDVFVTKPVSLKKAIAQAYFGELPVEDSDTDKALQFFVTLIGYQCVPQIASDVLHTVVSGLQSRSSHVDPGLFVATGGCLNA
ncbi:hypothetical protein BDV10DRAFT_185301 [Aspergillus recurvatus]